MIGITGGIGSGKSMVCKILETMGGIIYYADDRAKWLMEHDPVLVSKVTSLFGKQAYDNGKLSRSYLSWHVFNNDLLREKLNKAVHPAVASDVASWVAKYKAKGPLFKEAALLFETGSHKQLDKTILVVAPQQLRIARVLARDPQRSESEVRAIMSKQMRDEDKESLADFVLRNDGKHSLIKEVSELYQQLIIA